MRSADESAHELAVDGPTAGATYLRVQAVSDCRFRRDFGLISEVTPDGTAPSAWVACRALGGLRLRSGQPDISDIKAPPVKNALRPILRQLKNGPVVMKLDQPPAIDHNLSLLSNPV